jgi:TrkA domain protein
MDVNETPLPGVGLRYDFTTRSGRQIGVVSHRSGRLAELQQRVEGLAIDWLEIPSGSPYAGRPLGDTQARSRTGTSIVAVLRGEEAIPAPGPEEPLRAGDTAVVVGTPKGIAALTRLLGG